MSLIAFYVTYVLDLTHCHHLELLRDAIESCQGLGKSQVYKQRCFSGLCVNQELHWSWLVSSQFMRTSFQGLGDWFAFTLLGEEQSCLRLVLSLCWVEGFGSHQAGYR